MIGAVVFDFDGTLVDSNAIKRQCYDDVFAESPDAGPLIERTVVDFPAFSRYEVIARVLEQLGETPDRLAKRTRELSRRYTTLCEERIRKTDDFDGVPETLALLGRRYRVVINSATPQDCLRRVVLSRLWHKHCDWVLGGPATKRENLQHIGKRFSLRPREMVFVGDGDLDSEAAKAFGCHFVRAHPSCSEAPVCAELLIKRMSELPSIIEQFSTVSQP